jgi:TonB family protein
MTRVSPLFRFMPYGAPELLDAGRPNLARALVTASAASVLVFALFGALRLVHPGVVKLPVMPHVEILPPLVPNAPSLTPFEERQPVPHTAPSNSGSTIDQVIPDAVVKPGEPTFAQPDITGSWGSGSGVEGDAIILGGSAPAETLPARGAVVNVEVMPESLREVEPIYPSMAQELGMSGLVMVHMLVGRNGRVLGAVVDERTNDPMFNEASLAAARQWVFRPASNNGRTVAVWVTVPFKYTFLSH